MTCASGGLHPIILEFSGVMEQLPELHVKFLLRMARILRGLSILQTSSNPFSLVDFGQDSCRQTHNSLLDLLIVQRELEQDHRMTRRFSIIRLGNLSSRRAFHRVALDFTRQYSAQERCRLQHRTSHNESTGRTGNRRSRPASED